jgi:hypothetical protein
MERTWWEAIQLLGLDVQLAFVFGMITLEGLAQVAADAWRAIREFVADLRFRRNASVDDDAGDPWSTPEWRPST